MHAMAPHSDAERRGIATLACGFESLVLVFAVLVGVGALLFALLPPDPPTTDFARFTWLDVRPEPTERAVFVVLAVLGTGLCLCLPLVNRPAASRSPARMVASAIIAAAVLAFETARFFHGNTVSPFDERLFGLPVAVALAAVAIALSFSRARASYRFKAALGSMLSLVTLAVAIPQRLVLPSTIRDDPAHGWHLELILRPIVQTNGGGRCLIDYAPYYGCYAEWLKPWVRTFGQELGSVTFAFAALHVLAWIVLIVTLLVAIDHGVIGVAVALTLAVAYALAGLAGPALDPYSQYSPMRVLFPALSVAIVWWWTAHESRRATFLMSIGVGLGATWNFDSALATIVAWLAFLTFDRPGAPARAPSLSAIGRRLGAATAGLGVALLAVLLWIVARGGHARDLATAFAVYEWHLQGGFMQVAMPSLAHPWAMVVAVYGAGILVGGARLAGWLDDRRDRLALYLALLGLGLFPYYQSRSVAGNLISAMWPAFAVYALIADRVVGRLARTSSVGRTLAASVAWPVVLCGVLAVATAIVRAPNVPRTWSVRLSEIRTRADSAFAKQAAFVRETTASEPALIISIHEAALHAESGVPLVEHGRGISEMLLVSDNERIKARIAQGIYRHVFIGQRPSFLATPEMLLPQNDALRRHYVRAGLDPSQTLMHLVRR
jgi:hypothetical protein